MKDKFVGLIVESRNHNTRSFFGSISEERPKIMVEVELKTDWLTKTEIQKLMRDLYKHVQHIEAYERMKTIEKNMKKGSKSVSKP